MHTHKNNTWFENTAYQVESSKHVSGEDMHSKDTSVHSSHKSLALVHKPLQPHPRHVWKMDEAKAFVTSSIWLFLVCKYRGAGNLWDIWSLASLVPRPLPDFISQPWRKSEAWDQNYVTDRKSWVGSVHNVDSLCTNRGTISGPWRSFDPRPSKSGKGLETRLVTCSDVLASSPGHSQLPVGGVHLHVFNCIRPMT